MRCINLLCDFINLTSIKISCIDSLLTKNNNKHKMIAKVNFNTRFGTVLQEKNKYSSIIYELIVSISGK